MEGNVWATVRGSGHPLALLEGKPLAGLTLRVLLGPKSSFGALYFKIVLEDASGVISDPFLLALHHSGLYPSYNWIEIISLVRSVSFPDRKLALSESDIETLFRYLSDVIPPGGHIMVEYESGTWEETRLSLGCGIPPIVTSLGSMLFRAGFGVAFKDWHFAEGAREGPRKLQGHKALDEVHYRARIVAIAIQLYTFLQSEALAGCQQLWEAARERAKQLISRLSEAHPDVIEEILGKAKG